MQSAEITIQAAVWPQDAAIATALLRAYADFLLHNPAGAVNICLAGYEKELASLQRIWSEPHGVLLLAHVDGEPAGCVAVKVRQDRPGASEMKRLWVSTHFRGRQLGETLIQAAVQWCRSRGDRELLLDTVPAAMPEAVRLYRRMGFVQVERHNANDVSGLAFFALDLR